MVDDRVNTSPPPMGEIAVIRDGKDITRPFIEGLINFLTPEDRILLEKGNLDLRVYEDIYRDDQVKATFDQRIRAVTSTEWEVRAGGTRRVDQKAADSIAAQLKAIQWDDINYKQLFALLYGHSIAELMYARDGKEIVLDDTREGIKVRNRRRFKFDIDKQPRLLTVNNSLTGEILPDRKFWWFSTGSDHSDDPYGKGLGHWLFWPCFFKRGDMRAWLLFLEKFGMPTVLGKYQPGTPQDKKNTLLAAAYKLISSSAATIPETMQLELIEASRSGTASYGSFLEILNAAISKVVLSQTMTTDDGSSRSQAEVHDGVKRSVIKTDADLICQSFNRGPVKWLTDLNYPNAAYPEVWRLTEAEKDLKSQAERDKILFDMGFVPSIDYVQETYGDGFALPEDGQANGLNGEQLQAIKDIVGFVINGDMSAESARILATIAIPTLTEEQAATLIEEPPEPEPIPQPAGALPPAEDLDQVAALFSTPEPIQFRGRRGRRTTGKNCTVGISCGFTCIAASKTCRKTLSENQKALKQNIVGGTKTETASTGTETEHRPFMTEAEAEEYTRDSVIQDTLYHGTGDVGAESISTEGIDPERTSTALYGQGFYMASDFQEAANYAEEYQGSEVLSVKVLARNPRVFTDQNEFMRFKEEIGVDIHSSFGEAPRRVTEELRSQGFDSVQIESLSYTVVFDRSQVVTFKRDRVASLFDEDEL